MTGTRSIGYRCEGPDKRLVPLSGSFLRIPRELKPISRLLALSRISSAKIEAPTFGAKEQVPAERPFSRVIVDQCQHDAALWRPAPAVVVVTHQKTWRPISVWPRLCESSEGSAMIQSLAKRFQVTLWLSENRTGLAPHQEFDNREEAEQAFEEARAGGQFRAGILYQWDKRAKEWTLLRQYP